jgi:primosomal protein N' (replication factor Y) (superfamily II helicase)
LPLALPKRTYTYSVPESAAELVQVGVRVEVQFGRSRLYSGLVERIHREQPDYPVKPIISVLDEVMVVTPRQLQLWNWMAEYYCCTLGEVMQAALPGHLKLTSETRLVQAEGYGDDFSQLDNDEYLIAEALHIQKTITIDDARKILNKKTVFPVIQRLLNKGVLIVREELLEKFKPRRVTAVRLAEPYYSEPDRLREVFEKVEKSDRQIELLMSFMTLQKSRPFVRKRELLSKADVSESPLKTLVKNGVFEVYEREVSRLSGYDDALADAETLTPQQERVVGEINAHWQQKSVVLLHGVTGSGKTRVYVECIRKVLREGGQVLYLLPEIALTTQIISRLQRIFGSEVAVYHSKISYNERVELWRGAAAGKPVLLAARSGLFLPFNDLRLIIVDEEHDPSFKQYDPAPRYNARDTAIYLAHLYGAKVLLGTATPGVESYHNALADKYGLVEMPERIGGTQLPEIQMIDLRETHKKRQMQSIFAPALLEALQNAIDKGEQAILFQNRRGYAPALECQVCSWTATCKHCDISLTFHKNTNQLRCHYCGYQQEPATVCPACGSGKIVLRGFGTEKIEDELKIFLPKARVARMDMDTAGTRSNLLALLEDFEERRIDILVGTQMVTKGLDFDNVALVGVLGADQLTKFPDFRAGERAFQLLTQVAGRAGRRNKRGMVLIQAYNPAHPILQEVFNNDFSNFYTREISEREEFKYPPFYRLIHLQIRHKEPKTVQESAAFMAAQLRTKLGSRRVLGPVIPNVARIRGLFGQDILLKLEKNAALLSDTKALIRHTSELLVGKPGWSQVVISVDVDPV